MHSWTIVMLNFISCNHGCSLIQSTDYHFDQEVLSIAVQKGRTAVATKYSYHCFPFVLLCYKPAMYNGFN